MAESRRLASILQFSFAYEAFQRLVGKNKLRRMFIDDHVSPGAGERVLDVGCGPGDLVTFMPADTHYVGYDISERYIASANQRFGDRAEFLCGGIDALEPLAGTMDQAVAVGVLHHVDDSIANELLAAVWSSLKPGGRFVALEPFLYDGQHWIARELIKRDRGEYVRREADYAAICEEVFADVSVTRAEDLMRVPYTLSAYSCVKASS